MIESSVAGSSSDQPGPSNDNLLIDLHVKYIQSLDTVRSFL